MVSLPETTYPLVNVYITMENHHFNGKIDYKWPFSIAMLNYQRVKPGKAFGNGTSVKNLVPLVDAGSCTRVSALILN